MQKVGESLISIIEEIVEAIENNNNKAAVTAVAAVAAVAASQPKSTQLGRIQRKTPLTQQKPTLVDVLHHLRMAAE